MKLTSESLKLVVNDINEKINGSHITNIFLLNSTDIVLSFSFYRDEKLLISLNHFTPFISFISKNLTSPTILNKTNEYLRKDIKNSVVNKVSIFNDDRVVLFELENRDEFYQLHRFKMYIELIPHRSNLIVVNESGLIDFATTYTTLDADRKVLKGFPYEPLQKGEERLINEPFNYYQFKKEANEYIETSLTIRKKEKYKKLYTHLKGKVNSLSRKIKELERELNSVDEYVLFKEIGETIYAYISMGEEKELNEYIKNIPNYDATISPSDNAQKYFKKYKKAMRSKDMLKEQIELARTSLEEKSLLLNTYPYMDEEELAELSQEYLKIKKKGKPIPAYLPSYILVNNIKIGYGKNSKQNEYLTFKLAHKDYYYLHIENYHGSHVVIMNENPNDEIKLIAGEIVLILSNKEAGNVQITKISQTKKGTKSGQVLLNNYSLITLNKIRKETKDLLFDSKRFTN